MCIALPMRIVDVVDVDAARVAIEPGDGVGADRAGRDVVSAALIAEDAAGLAALVGRWGLVHAGFLVQMIEADDAAERLAIFAAMDGSPDAPALLAPTME